ncbi:MAG: alpha-N-arabinofuranosidase [Phycisphaerae bacterium]|nr:alpha-N-arabinofuranosidase [Phycisphaerae bacterium]
MRRRTFLRTAAAAGIGAWIRSRPILAADAMSPVEIDLALDDLGPVVSPHLYGHFIEHLGGVVYDGIWVGLDSGIPNTGGIRQQFIDDMRAIGAPNLRWPGGCFADGYHWRDGIGPMPRRPRTYNFWQSQMPQGLQEVESNQFGTHEFMRLCRLIGAEPYLAANMGSGTPREFHDWVLYCNAPARVLSLADERAANGDPDPFRIKYWGVGNESWGCGGDMKPAEYATLYRRYVTQFPAYTQPFLVAVGPRGHSLDGDLSWTTGFFEAMQGGHRSNVHGFALHFYSDFRGARFRSGAHGPAEWYAVLREGLRTESIIEAHWREMAKFDPRHSTRLVIDEWGVWYPSGTEMTPAFILSQNVTLLDALHTAMTLDIFNRHADKIEMANLAQTINCLHSLFMAHGDRYVRTPVYHVFDMYRAHMGARLVPLRSGAQDLTVQVPGGPATIPALSGSASVRDGRLTVTLVNPSLEAPISARLRLSGARPAEGRARVLTHSDMRAGNTFDEADKVRPAWAQVKTEGPVVQVDVPTKAVVALEVRLV